MIPSAVMISRCTDTKDCAKVGAMNAKSISRRPITIKAVPSSRVLRFRNTLLQGSLLDSPEVLLKSSNNYYKNSFFSFRVGIIISGNSSRDFSRHCTQGFRDSLSILSRVSFDVFSNTYPSNLSYVTESPRLPLRWASWPCG